MKDNKRKTIKTVTKSLFKDVLKCDRYAGLFYSEGLEEKIDEVNANVLPQDYFQKYLDAEYTKFELIVGQYIKKTFPGKVIFGPSIYKQKEIMRLYDDYLFKTYVDVYQEDDETIRIFEVKAAANKEVSKSYSKTLIDKSVYPSFTNTSGRIYEIDESPFLTPETIMDVNTNLFTKNSDIVRRINDLAFQKFVIEGVKHQKRIEYYLVLLNSEYIHAGQFDDQGEPVYEDTLFCLYHLDKLLADYNDSFITKVDLVVKRLNELKTTPVDVGSFCNYGGEEECPFAKNCFDELPKENSVFNLYRNSKRYEYFNEGYRNLEHVPIGLLQNEVNLVQHSVSKSGIPYVDKEMLSFGLNLLKYPLYHLDFETSVSPLPRFSGEKAYEKSVFQFSLHIEREPGVCDFNTDHYEYLAKSLKDEREELVKKMVDIIKQDGGSVIVYNKSFEDSRLKELAEQFPKYAKQINYIRNQLFDLIDLLRGNKELFSSFGDRSEKPIVYYQEFNGSYSLKKTLPALTEFSYEQLNIRNGSAAASAYLSFPHLSKEEYKMVQRSMKEYCKLDTWAMVKLLASLRELQ